MKRSLAVLVVAPVLLLSACSASENGVNPLLPSAAVLQGGATARAASALTGTWQLVSLQKAGQARQPAPAGVRLAADFGADGNVLLQADCNACRASYEAGPDGQLEVGPMACTRAYCSSAPVDTDFAGLVSAAGIASVSGDTLTLTSDAGTVSMQR